MGGKSKIARGIVGILQWYINTLWIDTYIEPFVGGCNIIDKIECKNRYGSDSNPYLIALLERVQSRKHLYENVSKELYDKARESYYKCDNTMEDWELGNIGFLASFNGKFFDGGYATNTYEKVGNTLRYRDYYRESKDNLLRQQENLQGVCFSCGDYKQWLGVKNSVIYCDPPYKNTEAYVNSKDFDYEEFWGVMRELSKDNYVFVSELEAPEDFICVWQKEIVYTINAKKKKKVVEKLFLHSSRY